MKKLILFISLFIVFTACEHDSPEPTQYGKIIVYSSDLTHRWSVVIDGTEQGSIGQSHSAPTCGNTSFQNFQLTTGTHSVYAKSLSGLASTTPITITISNNSCQPLNLPQ